mmetsp:Transcript_12408/g.11242  ORF Transcript_12408/g.11242 Transcript_12408/m.11242 type:complete len:476 (+) Transcript_12408:39-1466(+)
MFVLVIYVSILLILLNEICSHPTHLIETAYCSTALSTKSVIMNGNPVLSSERSISISRGSTQLSSGDKYVAGEVLTVTLSSTSNEFIYETTAGSFQSGGCNGLRVVNTATAYLTMPSSGDVDVKGAWATSRANGVHIGSTITLKDPSEDDNSGSSTTNYIYKYKSSLAQNLIVGLIFGVGGLIAAVLSYQIYINKYKSGVWNTFSNFMKSFISASISISLGIVAVILVAEWCQDYNNSLQKGFLGFPSWSNNPLSFHVLFMVGGFLFAQILAICSWIMFQSNHSIGKAFHFIFHTIGISSLYAGLVAIINYKWNNNSPSLTSLHSWFGVMAVALYSVNYLFGLFMGICKQFYPKSIVHDALSLKSNHRLIGLSAFGCALLATVTGIMAQYGRAGCYYNNTDNLDYEADKNPADNYRLIPNSCKLANGIGIVVSFIGFFMFLMVYFRSKIDQSEIKAHAIIPDNNDYGKVSYESNL